MAKWKEATLADLLPAAAEELINAANTLTETVGPPLQAVAGVTRTLANFLQDLAEFDPAAALVEAVAQLRRDVLGSGLKYLDMWDLPLLDMDWQAATEVAEVSDLGEVVQRSSRIFEAEDGVSGSFDYFLRKIALSLQDEADTSRPRSAGSVAGFVLCVGGPTPTALRDVLVQVLKLFPTRAEIQRILMLLDRRLGDDPAVVTRLVGSRPPDWQDTTLAEWFPGLVDILEELDGYVALLTPALNASSAILQAAAHIADKVARLVAQAIALNEALAQFLAVLSATGIYVVYVHSGRGVLDWAAQLQQATDRPPFADNGDSYVAGCAILVETVGVGTFSALFAPAFQE